MAPTGEHQSVYPAAGVRRFLASLAVVASIPCWIGDAAPEVASGPVPISPALVVDPNTAPAAVLTALPRVGPVLAGRIVAARGSAPLSSIGDLNVRVAGVGPATAAAIRPFLQFGPPIRKDEASPLR